jgi:hypothetical protein
MRIGSIVWCGDAAWPPRTMFSAWNASDAANDGPDRTHTDPTGASEIRCKPKTASTLGSCMGLSSNMANAPPGRISSDGWNAKTTEQP